MKTLTLFLDHLKVCILICFFTYAVITRNAVWLNIKCLQKIKLY